jgi:hypothetical protein
MPVPSIINTTSKPASQPLSNPGPPNPSGVSRPMSTATTSQFFKGVRKEIATQ